MAAVFGRWRRIQKCAGKCSSDRGCERKGVKPLRIRVRCKGAELQFRWPLWLAAASQDNTARVIEAATGKEIGRIGFGGWGESAEIQFQ